MIIMERDQKTIGLSREYIIHPGETLEEVLESRAMSQRELAIRTGVSEKHISTVIHAQKPISATFARKLEYALGIEASFWMNLQANYDQEMLEYEEVNNISVEEINVLKILKDVLECWSGMGWIDISSDEATQVLGLRRICCVSNLLDIPRTSYVASYRVQVKNSVANVYVLFAWQRMCEILTEDIVVAESVDVTLLRKKIPQIKEVMFADVSQIPGKLERIFSECGISFRIVPNFRGAPVQGFIKRNGRSLILCMTTRQKWADVFWFTMFHEIAHILNDDTKTVFVDFDSVSAEIETAADKMACEFLLAPKAYMEFVGNGDFSKRSIEKFASLQHVKSYIVEGRLMKEGRISWGDRPKYNWG